MAAADQLSGSVTYRTSSQFLKDGIILKACNHKHMSIVAPFTRSKMAKYLGELASAIS